MRPHLRLHTRTAAVCLVAIVVGSGLVVAPPALATFGAVVELPATTSYSPYGGPATVTFTFDGGDAATVFTVRLREPGHPAIKEKDYLISPATQTSPHPVSFAWNELSVTTATDYQVDVRRQDGGPVITTETFTVLPPLVSDVSVTPSTFYPLVPDGFKDRTTVRFALSADTTRTEIRVFRDDPEGRCCGKEIRTEDLGPRSAGTRRWTWDGTEQDGSPAPKGTYFVKVRATDADDVTVASRAQRVAIATGTIRRTATRKKDGSTYSRVADERQTAIGGDCLVSRNADTREAFILCANAEISVYWKWQLAPGERIESVSFSVDGGYYGCHKTKRHTKTESYMRVTPTSTCTVRTASITYSYPVQV